MTLHYPFPVIENIDDVLPHIDDNFRVVEKDGLTFINYNMMGPDVFPSVSGWASSNRLQRRIALSAAVRRECRGIVFDTKSGKIVSRPFHKFFNVGEREDMALSMIDVSHPHTVLEKLDGSMIRPIPTDAGMRWGTKMGITEVGLLAEEFVADKPDYEALARRCRSATPLFEFCSRKSRIVVGYPEDTMVLLAVRDNVSGEYWTRETVRALAEYHLVPVVDSVDHRAQMTTAVGGQIADLNEAVVSTKAAEEGEGKIIFFADGHAAKIKADWYVRVHRAKDLMRSERRLLDLVFNEELDDLLPTLPDEDRDRVNDYVSGITREVARVALRGNMRHSIIRETFPTKKDFALSDMAKELSPIWKSIHFGIWDEKFESADDAVWNALRSRLSSDNKIEAAKEDLGIHVDWDAVWAPEEEGVAA